MMTTNAAQDTEIRGVVSPVDWDDEDHVTAISIFTSDDAEYAVELNSLGRDLLDFLDEEVVVHGIVRVDAEGVQTVRVKEFDLVEPPEESGGGDDEWREDDRW